MFDRERHPLGGPRRARITAARPPALARCKRRAVGPFAGILLIAAAAAFAGIPASRAHAQYASPSTDAQPECVWLDSMDLSKMGAGWGTPQACKSCEQRPLTLAGIVYPHGVGTHAPSSVLIDLKGAATRFVATVGLDDERKGQGAIVFEIWADDKKLLETGVMHGGDAPMPISIDLVGRKRLLLIVNPGGSGIDNDHADWADAAIVLARGATARPAAIFLPSEPPPPIHHGVSPLPAIHGPRVVGTTPRRPFLFRIPATGQGPLHFAVRPLPTGLRLDPAKGILTGAVARPGSYKVEIVVRGARGVARRGLTIEAGARRLALTPPMGWNSWYAWFDSVDQKKLTQAADAMVATGLAAHGFQYVDIDDCWEGTRDTNGDIRPNGRFPNMKALGDHIHSLGLRFGIYSSPGPKTCGNYEASYRHEEQDARTYASWGVDLLKYDLCSYSQVADIGKLADLQKPYRLMKSALEASGRDMVYNLCEYGVGDVWKWGGDVGGNSWRTTGDSGDTWSTISSIGFSQAGHEKYAGPGRWNDPDYLQVGMLGGQPVRPTHLTPNEQITQLTLWCLLAAPLFLSCDLTRLDPFTLDLLTNDEVLDVDQDPLGRAAGRRAGGSLSEVWARPLSDGTLAVGLFNRGVFTAKITARWSDLGLIGPKSVRDLWQQKELGRFARDFTCRVPAHGAVLVRIGTPRIAGQTR